MTTTRRAARGSGALQPTRRSASGGRQGGLPLGLRAFEPPFNYQRMDFAGHHFPVVGVVGVCAKSFWAMCWPSLR